MRRGVERAGSLAWLGVICGVGLLVVLIRRGQVLPAGADRPLALIELSLILMLAGLAVTVLVGRAWRRGISPSRRTDTGPGFVMHTFQGLLHELKTKETRLESLRANAVARAEQVESYYENILRSIASGVITCDCRGNMTTFNASAERILGHNASEVIGRSCEAVFGAPSPITRMVMQSLVQRVPISRQEWTFARDADRVCVGVSSAVLRDRHDEVIGVALVFTDLTEVKRLEEQIEGDRRLAALGEMSAGIAHEFRTYMGTILGWAKLLGKRHPEGDESRPMVEAIIGEITAMQRLTDDLLAFGRDFEPQRRGVEMESFVRESTVIPSDQPEIRLAISVSGALPREAQWDPVLMRQAIQNLIQNAMEAMPEGGTLTVGLSPSSNDVGAVDLTIVDTGVGIPAQHLDRIFLPFFTLKAKGHGLGLALVRKIVVAHGGRVHVHSQEGVGSTFLVTMPIRAPGSMMEAA
ncbi:MAG: ATP-binding protein [Nitrospiria bacterium]